MESQPPEITHLFSVRLLVEGLDSSPSLQGVEDTLDRILEAVRELSRASNRDNHVAPTHQERIRRSEAKHLIAAATIVDRYKDTASELLGYETTPGQGSGGPPRLPRIVPDIEAVERVIAFLRLLADRLTSKNVAWEKFSSTFERPLIERFVWRTAREWSDFRRQSILESPIGSADAPLGLLRFMISAVVPLIGEPPPPRGTSPANLRRTMEDLRKAIRVYGPRVLRGVDHPLAPFARE